jgi:2-keto-4-pentenoate hydratase
VRALIGTSVDDGYAVQDINTETWVASGRKVCGYKVGLTSAAVQQQMGVNQPDFGILFSDMSAEDGGKIEFDKLHQPRAEAEIAFILGDDLTSSSLSMAGLIDAIEFAAPAIEIVGSRIRGWDIQISDTIADNASSGAYVLGGARESLSSFDPVAASMVMTRNGQPVSSGTGAACLGNPLDAALWLAGQILGRGRRITAGQVLLTGALGPMVEVSPGDIFEATISGLGSVSVAFGPVRPRSQCEV